ncbi:unnamed protein product [Linum tenue]|uniref:PAS domain-containing protein n=1 Tax=Linum tenue TaxID=586396 RepID=A0AAV0S182_9ROSI|nr:unnamed protein product [Linum tenue]
MTAEEGVPGGGGSLPSKFRCRNRGAENLYGYSAAEALGRHLLELIVDPSDTTIAQNIVHLVFQGESWAGQFPMSTKSGDRLTVVVGTIGRCGIPVQAVKLPVGIAPAFESAAFFRVECCPTRVSTVLWELYIMCPVVWISMFFSSSLFLSYPLRKDFAIQMLCSLWVPCPHLGVSVSLQSSNSGGSLFQLLQRSTAKLEWGWRVNMALDIASSGSSKFCLVYSFLPLMRSIV